MQSLYRSSIIASRSLRPSPALRLTRAYATGSANQPQRPPPTAAVNEQAAHQIRAEEAASAATAQAISGGSDNRKPASKHRLVYREIWPPLIRVLAYGSAVYFSLQLLWQYLDGLEQARLEADVRRELEEEVRKEMEKRAAQTETEKSTKGWLEWLTGR